MFGDGEFVNACISRLEPFGFDAAFTLEAALRAEPFRMIER
jgi:hypothetical protein